MSWYPERLWGESMISAFYQISHIGRDYLVISVLNENYHLSGSDTITGKNDMAGFNSVISKITTRSLRLQIFPYFFASPFF
jgi:hypothetical protein